MKILFLVLVVSSFSTGSFAQWSIPAQMRAENTLDRLSDRGGLSNSDILYGVPMSPGKVIGDNYLNKHWNTATILLYQSETMIEGFPVKYDLKSDLIEIKTKSGIKILGSDKIKNIVWIDSVNSVPHYFVSATEFKRDGVESRGLLEVIVDGKLPLLKKTEIFVKQPTYNAALDAGSKDTKIFQKEIYYSAKEKDLIKIKSKNDILLISGDQSAQTSAFMKENKININKLPDLKRVFEFLNKGR
jgi:hypothetical protein